MNTRNKQLAGRLFLLADNVVKYCRALRWTVVSRPIVSQLVRSATSVGANYVEACGAITFKDWRHKMGICLKELNETAYWLELVGKNRLGDLPKLRLIFQECRELRAIFLTIIHKTRSK